MAETIAPMVAAVGFNTTYASTLEWFPGFVFLLAAAVIFASFAMISFVHIHSWKHSINPDVDQDPLLLNDDAVDVDDQYPNSAVDVDDEYPDSAVAVDDEDA